MVHHLLGGDFGRKRATLMTRTQVIAITRFQMHRKRTMPKTCIATTFVVNIKMGNTKHLSQHFQASYQASHIRCGIHQNPLAFLSAFGMPFQDLKICNTRDNANKDEEHDDHDDHDLAFVCIAPEPQHHLDYVQLSSEQRCRSPHPTVLLWCAYHCVTMSSANETQLITSTRILPMLL